MPIAIFENRETEPLRFVVEPSDVEYEIPHLARLGIRYSSPASDEDRAFYSVSEGQIAFWCEGDHEVDIVLPTAATRLMWEMCVGYGLCGGIVDGAPTHVEDLLPQQGMVSADDFARLTGLAEGDQQPSSERQAEWVKARFIEHMQAEAVDVGRLREIAPNPFDRSR